MPSDDEIVDYDSGTLDSDPTRERIDFIATERALYVFGSRTGHKQRFSYQQFEDVFWEPDSLGWKNRFIVKLLDGSGFSVTMQRAPTGMAAYVKQRVSEVERPVLLERHLPLDDEGHGATLRYQLISDTGDYAWRTTPDPGLEFTEERNERLQAFLKELKPEAIGATYKARNPGSIVLADRGHYVSFSPSEALSKVKSNEFGDGIMVGLTDGYVFETDTGGTSNYPWDTVRAYRFDGDTGEILLKLAPLLIAAIYVKAPHDPGAWRSLLNRQGVKETDNPIPFGD